VAKLVMEKDMHIQRMKTHQQQIGFRFWIKWWRRKFTIR